MMEEVIYGPTGLQVTLQWKKNWYRIPFFVLDDLLNEWIIGFKPNEKELARWLNTWKWPNAWTYHPVNELKRILKDEMVGMEAYRLYD